METQIQRMQLQTNLALVLSFSFYTRQQVLRRHQQRKRLSRPRLGNDRARKSRNQNSSHNLQSPLALRLLCSMFEHKYISQPPIRPVLFPSCSTVRTLPNVTRKQFSVLSEFRYRLAVGAAS